MAELSSEFMRLMSSVASSLSCAASARRRSFSASSSSCSWVFGTTESRCASSARILALRASAVDGCCAGACAGGPPKLLVVTLASASSLFASARSSRSSFECSVRGGAPEEERAPREGLRVKEEEGADEDEGAAALRLKALVAALGPNKDSSTNRPEGGGTLRWRGIMDAAKGRASRGK